MSSNPPAKKRSRTLLSASPISTGASDNAGADHGDPPWRRMRLSSSSRRRVPKCATIVFLVELFIVSCIGKKERPHDNERPDELFLNSEGHIRVCASSPAALSDK